MHGMQYKKGMVFGVFDTLHPGHEYFLSEASRACGKLVVVVALPEVVVHIKKKMPKDTLEDRIQNIKNFDQHMIVVPGDEVLGSWGVLTLHKPDIVFLGYDQQGLASELAKRGVPYRYIGAHHPEKYKSSLM